MKHVRHHHIGHDSIHHDARHHRSGRAAPWFLMAAVALVAAIVTG